MQSPPYAIGLFTPDRVSLLDPPYPTRVDCRIVFVADNGQRIRLTMYNFDQYQTGNGIIPNADVHFRFPCHVRGLTTAPGTGDDDAENAVDTQRKCDTLKREKPLATTNGSEATLFLSNGYQGMPATVSGRKWDHILKLEGRPFDFIILSMGGKNCFVSMAGNGHLPRVA